MIIFDKKIDFYKKWIIYYQINKKPKIVKKFNLYHKVHNGHYKIIIHIQIII